MININYLSHNRTNFSELTFHFLNKIKKENKLKIKLTILCSKSCNFNLHKLEDISTEVKIFESENNYLSKIQYAIKSDCKYSIKLDEDCFINNHVWDYIIENIEILDNPENLLLSPTMTNNIPSCDLFIEDYVKDQDFKNRIYECFLNREMPVGLWGVDYSPLNQYTILANSWNSKDYYAGLSLLETPIKGMHPLRISYEAQVLINDYILQNVDRFLNKNDYSIVELISPYFTNSLFAIKTSEWKNILDNMYVDQFDEIALNDYKKTTNKKFLFIKNGFGIHPMYNTVFGNKNPWGIGAENGEQSEKDFFNSFKNIIIKKIHCIGDSHSAVFSGKEEMVPIWPELSDDITEYFKTYRIGPATAYKLENKIEIINSIIENNVNKDNDHVLFCFGEVDIRAHLIKQSELQNVDILKIVEECVDQYFKVILYYKQLGYKTIAWGPIASWHESKPYTGGPSFGTCLERNIVTEMFNKRLEMRCDQYDVDFLTIFYEMIDDNKITIPKYLDNWEGSHIHLSQTSMPLIIDAFKRKNLI